MNIISDFKNHCLLVGSYYQNGESEPIRPSRLWLWFIFFSVLGAALSIEAILWMTVSWYVKLFFFVCAGYIAFIFLLPLLALSLYYACQFIKGDLKRSAPEAAEEVAEEDGGATLDGNNIILYMMMLLTVVVILAKLVS